MPAAAAGRRLEIHVMTMSCAPCGCDRRPLVRAAGIDLLTGFPLEKVACASQSVVAVGSIPT